MGGRGSRSSGAGRAPNGFSTVGKIRGISVIQDRKSGRGLPINGPSNGSYYRKSRGGTIDQLRIYDGKGSPQKDIDKGHDHGQGDPHVHDWINGRRSFGRKPNNDELKLME